MRKIKPQIARAIASLFSVAMVAGSAWAQSITLPPMPSTAASEEYPEVTCTSTNAGVNADILQLASDTRDQLSPVLKLGSKWLFPVHVHVVMPDDPLADRISEEREGVTASEKTMTLEVALPFSDPELKPFVQRQFVTALLWEKFFAETHSFNAHTNLAVAPLWLIEGLNERVRDDPERDREEIVRRAATNHRAPSLKEITGWQEISSDRLLGLYQRAFCYYLVNSLVHGDVKRAEFQEWLATLSGGNATQANLLFPTEAGWQAELLDAPERSHDIVYTWEESASALSDAETIVFAGKKPKDTRICTLDTIAGYPRDSQVVATLQKKVLDLMQLELRAHPSWRPVFALYRLGLTALINDHPAQAETYFRQAQQQRATEVEYHQKLTDYVNWFEVTKDYAEHVSRFNTYFSTAKAMEQVQADPTKPNPIRADLIQVESQL